MKYLLDTNICIFYIKGMFQLGEMLDKHDIENHFISEITLAELKFGVENSEKKDKNRKALEKFLVGVTIIPIFHAIDLYAKEKARLRKRGITIDDFDLLIGVTSVTNDLVMVTNNVNHFQHIENIRIEDWTVNAISAK